MSYHGYLQHGKGSMHMTRAQAVDITEGNNWGDRFWGVCDGEGLNILGKLIMEQRTVLQRGSA